MALVGVVEDHLGDAALLPQQRGIHEGGAEATAPEHDEAHVVSPFDRLSLRW